nr:PhM00016.1 [Neoporphyra haitanensis]
MGVAGWTQKTFRLAARPRGCHLITKDIVGAVPELRAYKVGLAHIFIRHTSAGLTLNENADPDVRKDMKMLLGEMVVDGHPRFVHRDEGDDDMAAHVVSTLVGSSVSVPVTDGRLALGTWQGVWLVEWRNAGGGRSITVTVQGEKQ